MEKSWFGRDQLKECSNMLPYEGTELFEKIDP